MQLYSGVCERAERDDDMWDILVLNVRDRKGTFGVCLFRGGMEKGIV